MAPPYPSSSFLKRRPVLVACLGGLTVLALILVWQRHPLLRWLATETLAHVLQAEVQLGSLEYLGDANWRLNDLEVNDPNVEPRLRRAHISLIEVSLPWSALRQGVIPHLTAHGGVLHLTLTAEPPPSGDPPPKIQHLRLTRLQLSWGEGGDGQSIKLDADLSHPTTAPRGQVRLQAPWLDLPQLLEAGLGREIADFEGRQNDLDLRILWSDAGPGLEFSAGSAHWKLAKTRGTIEPWRLDFDPTAAEFQLALGRLSVQENDHSWQEDALLFEGQATPPSPDGATGWQLQAKTAGRWFEEAQWTAAWHPSGRFEGADLELRNWRWQLPGGASATLDTRLAWLEERWDVDVLLHGLDRPSSWHGLTLNSARLPLRAQFQGETRPAAAPDAAPSWFDGTLSLQSADDLQVVARGAWHLLEDPPRLDLELTASEVPLASLQEFLNSPLLPEPWQGDGEIGLRGTLQGPLTSPHGDLTLTASGATLQTPEVEVQLRQASVQLLLLETSQWPTVHGKDVTVRGAVSDSGDLEADFHLNGSFELGDGLDPQRLALQRLHLDGGALGTLEGSGGWRAESDGSRAQLQWTVSDSDVATLLERLPQLSQHEALRGATVQGQLGGSWTLTLDTARGDLDSNAAWTLRGPLRIEGLGYASADSSRVIEGAGLNLESELRLGENGTWQGSLDGKVDGFLLLWDTFFGDFEAWQSHLALQAEGMAPWPLEASSVVSLDAPAPSVQVMTMASTLAWPEGPRLELALKPDAALADAWHLEGQLSINDLASLHRRYLVPSFGDAAGQHLEGGLELHAVAQIAPGAMLAEGKLTLQDTAWTGLAGTSMEGLGLDLPFGLALPDGAALGPVEPGTLRFQRATAGGFQLPATETALWTEGAAFGLVEPLVLSLYGGRVALRELQVRDLLDQPRLRAALQLEGLDLGAMSRELGLPAFEGQLNGELERVDITQQELWVDGGGSLDLFGGRVDIGEISGSEIFTPFPRLELSADLYDIDLGKLTRQVDFGEMHGTLQGSIEGCSLFRGIPVTCRARFETVQRPGVRRSVDVKAVNNLTVLGTGARTNVFDRGIQRLFKRFTYDRFGVSIDLASDALLLQGLERRGDKELFMSGRLPFPIDIVNAQPGRRVSFQAMLERLNSLDFEGVTTAPPPP